MAWQDSTVTWEAFEMIPLRLLVVTVVLAVAWEEFTMASELS